jgi:hypothetical protein
VPSEYIAELALDLVEPHLLPVGIECGDDSSPLPAIDGSLDLANTTPTLEKTGWNGALSGI